MWQKRFEIAVIAAVSLLVASLVIPWIQMNREAVWRTQSKNNLRQIGLALSNYAELHNGYPPGGTFNREGRGCHGWMTFILPYMEDTPLPNYINFNYPWDSTQNAGLFLTAHLGYENPSQPVKCRHWEFPLAHYSANSHLLAANSFVNPKSTDLSSAVFLVGELGGGYVPWACPYNWRELDSINAKPPIFGRATRDGCQLLFVDGRVEFVENRVSKDILNRMSGDDLTGTRAAGIHIPLTFNCPADTLSLNWTYENENRFEVRQDIQGNIISKKRSNGK